MSQSNSPSVTAKEPGAWAPSTSRSAPLWWASAASRWMGITVPDVVLPRGSPSAEETSGAATAATHMTCETQTTLVLAVMAAANPVTISSADAGQAPSSTRSMPAI